LENSVINAGEVAAARGLVLLRAEGEGVYVDTCVGGTGVVLEGLDDVEVAALTLRETILAVELELGSDDGVLAPTVHVKSGLGEDECAGIGDKGLLVGGSTPRSRAPLDCAGTGNTTGGLKSAGHLEKAGGVDVAVVAFAGANCGGAAESVDGVGKSINGISVVEGLGTECAVEDTGSIKG